VGGRAARCGGPRAGSAQRLPVLPDRGGVGQDDRGPDPRHGPELRATHSRLRRASPAARCDPLPAHLDRCPRIWMSSSSMPHPTAGVDDARDLRERAMYGREHRGRIEGLYRRRSAHADARGVERTAEDSRGAAAPRCVFVFRDDGAAEDRQHRGADSCRGSSASISGRIGPHAIVSSRLKQVAAAEQLKVEDDALHLIARSANGGMRDALSLLDQVLSFWRGPGHRGAVCGEVLGLIPDELYAEMLRAIVERGRRGPSSRSSSDCSRPAADLSEFVNGAG